MTCETCSARSSMALRTRWEKRTGGVSRISSRCHSRSDWPPSMGCSCSQNSGPRLRSVMTGDYMGNLFYPGNMLPFTGGEDLPKLKGKGGGAAPSQTWWTGWEGGGTCSAGLPCAPADIPG